MSWITTAQEVVDLAKKAASVELQKKILELQAEGNKLLEEKIQLELENRSLRDALESRATLTLDGGVYFAPDDPVPFCVRCWEVEHKRLHITRMLRGGGWKCPACGAHYRVHPQTIAAHRGQEPG